MLKHRYILRSFGEIYDLSKSLSQFFLKPEDVHTGIYELLFNALEHGNLGIGYDTKTALLRDGRWEDELHKRLLSPENRDKVVEIEVKIAGDSCALTIRDQGNGFDWKTYLYSQPAAAPIRHGRGLFIARRAGIPLHFNEAGNEITLMASA